MGCDERGVVRCGGVVWDGVAGVRVWWGCGVVWWG